MNSYGHLAVPLLILPCACSWLRSVGGQCGGGGEDSAVITSGLGDGALLLDPPHLSLLLHPHGGTGGSYPERHHLLIRFCPLCPGLLLPNLCESL